MNLIDKIILLFKPEKFDILCYNEQEWIDIQQYLFKLGYRWSKGRQILKRGEIENWEWPVIIKNYRSDDKFASHALIIDDYRYRVITKLQKQIITLMNEKELHPNIDFINAKTFMRKNKLKRISNAHN